MSYHEWGDSWPHWDELYEAEHWIANYVYTHSLCRLQSKEKYGTIRYEHIWPPAKGAGPIIKLPFPIFHKKIIFGGEIHKFPRYLLFWTSSWLYYKWRSWGDKMLGRAVKKACIKFPNVIKEITEDLNWNQ